MDFIEHDALADQTVEKALWIKHHAANPREFTVEIFNFGEIPTKAGFSDAPHASEPDDGSLLPRAFEQFQPESPVYHTKLYLHIVALNEREILFLPIHAVDSTSASHIGSRDGKRREKNA